MLKIVYHKSFIKDFKRIEKRGYNTELLKDIIKKLSSEEKLDAKYKDHPLKGNFKGYRECHIASDWILIYKIHKDTLILGLLRTGTHSDIFKHL